MLELDANTACTVGFRTLPLAQSIDSRKPREFTGALSVIVSCGLAGWEPHVQHYRAYIIGDDGHIFSAVDLACEHEDAARALAVQLVDGHDVELWQGGRQIAVFERKPE